PDRVGRAPAWADARRADARALGVEGPGRGVHRDLGAPPRLAGDGADGDLPRGHLRHLLLEQAADQVGVGARDHDRGVASAPADVDHHHLEMAVALRGLAGDLLLDGEERGEAVVAQPPGIAVAALDQGVDQLAAAGRALTEHAVALGVAQPAADRAADGERRRPGEVGPGIGDPLAAPALGGPEELDRPRAEVDPGTHRAVAG